MRFTTTPVFSNTNLREKIAEIEPLAEAIASLVFINCGGNIDLQREWFYAQEHDVKAYIIDSHRPIFHMSVNDDT